MRRKFYLGNSLVKLSSPRRSVYSYFAIKMGNIHCSYNVQRLAAGWQIVQNGDFTHINGKFKSNLFRYILSKLWNTEVFTIFGLRILRWWEIIEQNHNIQYFCSKMHKVESSTSCTSSAWLIRISWWILWAIYIICWINYWWFFLPVQ